LAAEQNVSLLTLLGAVFSPLALILLFALGPVYGVIGTGVCGLGGLIVAVSTVRYRVGLFTNQFPHWNSMNRGRVSVVGISVFDGESWTLHRWDWFSHAIVAKSVICFFPAGQSKCPVFVGKAMLQPNVHAKVNEEWLDFDKAVRRQLVRERTLFQKQGTAIDHSRGRRNMELFADQQRERTVTIESGAIPFSGDVTTDDLQEIPEGNRGGLRTLRSQIVLVMLWVFTGLVIGGISELVLGAFWILLGVYLMSIFAWWIRARTSTVLPTKKRRYFLLGHATEDRIWLDFGVTISSFAWRDMQVIVARDDFIALMVARREQVVIARLDMFEDAEQWTRFSRIAQQHTTPSLSE